MRTILARLMAWCVPSSAFRLYPYMQARDVWAILASDPEFAAAMRRAADDFATGRVAPFRHSR